LEYNSRRSCLERTEHRLPRISLWGVLTPELGRSRKKSPLFLKKDLTNESKYVIIIYVESDI